MTPWLGMRARLRQLFRRGDAEDRMAEEMRFHIEMETARHVRNGLSAGEAHRLAMISFGGVELHKETMRDARRVPFVEVLLQDVRYALRSLHRDHAFVTTTVTTLALGIGAATTMFSVLNGITLRELPMKRAAEVVVVWKAPATRPEEHLPLTFAELASFRQQTRRFASVAGVAFQGAVDVVMREGPRAIPVVATWVTGDFFAVLDVAPTLGRVLDQSDDVPGAAPVMLVSHAFWLHQLNGDASVIGRALTYNGKQFVVVGVLPRGFEYPKRVQVWFPVLPAFPATRDVSASGETAMVFDAVGRMRAGVRKESAVAEFDAFLHAGDAQRDVAARGMRATLVSIADRISGDVRSTIWASTFAVAMLLTIACINVGNLLLIRGAVRTQELAIRTVLGAGRARLVRQLFTEAAILAGVGGTLGVLLAIIAVRVIVAFAPPELPQRAMIDIDARVVLVALLVTVLATLMSGVLPAVVSARGDLGTWLRGGRGMASVHSKTHVLRHALVVGQVSLAVLVAISSGLLARTLQTLQHLELGFNANDLSVWETTVLSNAVPEHARQIALQKAMVQRVAAIPGVVSVTSMPKPPYSAQGGWIAMYSGEGQSPPEVASNPAVNFEVVGLNYFRTFGIPLIRGRAFDDRDREDGARVAIVSLRVAQQTWPGVDPIGRRIKLGPPDSKSEWHTVVGMVDETRYRDLTTTQPTLFLPMRQFAGPVPMTLAIRTQTGITGVSAQIRRALPEVHPDLVLVAGGSMSQLLAAPLARPRFTVLLFGSFAVITLLLALVGIFGALAVTVRERTRELGIRLALGAQPNALRMLVLRQGMRLVAIGSVIGVGFAFAMSRWTASLLYGISPVDPATYAAVVCAVLAAAAVACWLPARRASQVDPLRTLRNE